MDMQCRGHRIRYWVQRSLPTRMRSDAFTAGAVSVPVPLNIQAEDIVTIVNEAELACLICSLDELGNLSRLVGGCPTVKTLVVMDLPLQLDSDTEVLLREVGPMGRAQIRLDET